MKPTVEKEPGRGWLAAATLFHSDICPFTPRKIRTQNVPACQLELPAWARDHQPQGGYEADAQRNYGRPTRKPARASSLASCRRSLRGPSPKRPGVGGGARLYRHFQPGIPPLRGPFLQGERVDSSTRKALGDLGKAPDGPGEQLSEWLRLFVKSADGIRRE